MTKISLSTVFVHLLVYLLSMRDILTMTADPADYIWINYNSKQPMTKISNNQYTATLPCESRIGKCSFRYNLLPLGWQANRNGMLTIPESDAVR